MWLAFSSLAGAQTAAPARIVGTIVARNMTTGEIEIEPDNQEAVLAKLTADSQVQHVAPGEKDLKNAQAMNAAEIAAGDRVLVVLVSGTHEIRRIVVMPAGEIAKRDAADRQQWIVRGVSGVVTAKAGNQITLKRRTFQGESQAAVVVSDSTSYRRYKPDSVKFSDASKSSLDAIEIGDQLRARGQKNDDGSKVEAEEVVFGSFATRAGTIEGVDPETKVIRAKEWGTGAVLTVHVTDDSQIKTMPGFPPKPGAGGPGGGGGVAGPPGGFPGGVQSLQAGGGPPPGTGGPPDIAQMLEHMPTVALKDLMPGQAFVVSSTKGAQRDELTAITLLANAEMLIRMASITTEKGTGAGMGVAANAPGLGGLTGALQGLDLSGMTP